MKNCWECKIGECEHGDLPKGADLPMRLAIAEAYRKITGREPDFCFSGWGAQLTELERAVVEDRLPQRSKDDTKKAGSVGADRRQHER